MNAALFRLEALGTTAAEVAESLRAMGVRGVRGNPCTCPIARYLGPGWEVSGNEAAGVDVLHYRLVSLPSPVRAFLRGFDGGLYPELECEATPATPGPEVSR